MGYRSQIIIVLADEYAEEFATLLSLTDLVDPKTRPSRTGFTIYEYPYIEWDSSDPLIEHIEEWLSNLYEMQGSTRSSKQGCLVRLGEEFGDYEEIIGNGIDFDIFPMHELYIEDP